MSGQSYSNKARKELNLLKDKFKYWRIIRKLSGQQAGADMASAQGGVILIIKKVMGKIQSMMPDFLLYNIVSLWVFRIGISVINKKVAAIKGSYQSNLNLFEADVPESFQLPEAAGNIEVSIVVPVHNKYAFTHKCLFSIKENTPGIHYEVIIADDASSDETVQIQTKIRHVLVVRNEKSLGFLGNCNRAAQQARGRYILFLNNDTVVQPGWLSSLIKPMEADATIGMTGSKLVYPEGILQEAGGIVWQNGSGWNYGKMFDPESPEYNYVKEVDYISGASLMIRSSLWKQIGGFDTRYTPAYYEDTDLAFEVRKAGYKVVYQPQSVVVHFEGISHGTDTGTGIKKYQEINRQKFTDKWADVLTSGQCKDESQLFMARDRSKTKKTLVFIDHYVPEFDKDAGSKSCFQYLKLFKKLGLNVKFIGDSYIRTEPYTTVLQQMGIEVLYGFEYQQNWQKWFLQNEKEIDYVFLNRPHVTAKYIDFIRKHSHAKIVYYGHDLHYLREQRQYAITKESSLLESSASWKQKEYAIFAQSDIVLYPSTEEVKEIKQTNPSINAFVLPLNVYEHSTANHESLKPETKKDLLFVGGFNHPPNEDAVLWFVQEIFPLIREQIPGVRFNIVGSKVTPAILKLASPEVVVKGFVSDEELAQLYKTSRVVVAPLRYGAGVKGKIIEALYHRCAVVTTPIGVEGISNQENLITIADTAAIFAQAVVELYGDDNKIASIYEQTPTYINAYFSEEGVKQFVEAKIL